MAFWQENVSQIITSNGFPLLNGAGSVSHARMEKEIVARYTGIDERRKENEAKTAELEDEADRITSYNVCYTKLLRYAAAKTLREKQTLDRDDGKALHYTLVNIKDWCKNSFEVINQLRMSTDYGSHRYDVILLINGVPVVQIELKGLKITPRTALKQIVDYKNDPGSYNFV